MGDEANVLGFLPAQLLVARTDVALHRRRDRPFDFVTASRDQLREEIALTPFLGRVWLGHALVPGS